MSKLNSTSKYVKAFTKGLTKVAPRLYDPCPFIGPVEMWNVPPPEQFLSVAPSGYYQVKLTIRLPKMNLVVYALVEFENYH